MQLMEARRKFFAFYSHLELMLQFYQGILMRKILHSRVMAAILIYVVVYSISLSIVGNQKSRVCSFPMELTRRTLT